MKASALLRARPFLDVLVYGDSGSGKSTFGADTPDPYICLTESHALPSIANVNPDAEVELCGTWLQATQLVDDICAGAPCVKEDGQVAYQFTRRARPMGSTVTLAPGEDDGRFDGLDLDAQEATEHVIQTLVIDAISDLHDKVRIVNTKTKDDEDDTNWMRAQDGIRNLLGRLRAVPINVVVLCLGEEREDSRKRRRYLPSVYGARLRALLGQWFSCVGVAQKTGDFKYRIAWQLGARYITKQTPALPRSMDVTLGSEGRCTLGSMLLASYPDNEAVPHRPGDNADVIEAAKREEEEEEEEDNTGNGTKKKTNSAQRARARRT